MIRKIEKDESYLLYPFVYRIFADMDLPLLKEVRGRDLKNIVVDAMENPHYRYGYEHTWVYEEDGQIIGALFGYPGNLEDFVDGPLAFSLVEHGYSALPPKEGKEALPHQWLLAAVVVAPRYRGKGIAQQLVEVADNLAKEAGYSTISVNCPGRHECFKHILSKAGYRESTRLLISNLPFFHMTKKVYG